MSRTAFYCRCGARLVGAERMGHRCASAQTVAEVLSCLVCGGDMANRHASIQSMDSPSIVVCEFCTVAAKRVRDLRGIIADDAYAIAFQTLGQYRKALLDSIDGK